jgi:predicted enzyme related to lactoylglutathione lyase
MTAHGTVDWFLIDTTDPEGAKKFYGDLLNWTFSTDAANDGPGYTLVTPAGGQAPQGGIVNTRGESPNRAFFYAQVANVAAAVEQAEQLGGKVVTPAETSPNGLTFASLQDPAGNHFGVYSPPGS